MSQKLPVSTPMVFVRSFAGKHGRVMGVFRLHDPRPRKLGGYSVAVPIEQAIRRAKKLCKERGGALFINGLPAAYAQPEF